MPDHPPQSRRRRRAAALESLLDPAVFAAETPQPPASSPMWRATAPSQGATLYVLAAAAARARSVAGHLACLAVVRERSSGGAAARSSWCSKRIPLSHASRTASTNLSSRPSAARRTISEPQRSARKPGPNAPKSLRLPVRSLSALTWSSSSRGELRLGGCPRGWEQWRALGSDGGSD